jgi:hypothetical protein
MTLDPRVREAIVNAVAAEGQSTALADRLLAWFEALSSNDTSLEDRDAVTRHVELLYEATTTTGDADGEGGQ